MPLPLVAPILFCVCCVRGVFCLGWLVAALLAGAAAICAGRVVCPLVYVS